MKPASFAWLVAHEVRLAFRQRAGRSPKAQRIAIAVVGLMALGFGIMLSRAQARVSLDRAMLTTIDLGLLLLASLMVSQGLILAVRTLYERGDLELLLPSPIAPRTLFAAKMAGVAASIASAFLLFAGLFILPLAIFVDVRWLAAFVTLGALALLATAVAAPVAILLFRWLGPRRTRGAAQILAALVGASMFLGTQVARFLPSSWFDAVISALPRGHLLARAATGEPASLLLALGGSAAAFAVMSVLLGPAFLRQAARAPAQTGTGRRRATRFTTRLSTTIIGREIRLIVRDGSLLFPIVIRALYLLPLLAPFVTTDGISSSTVAAALTLFCAQLCGNFARVTLGTEDAPDLLHTSPASQIAIRQAKLGAALLPALALAALPIAVLAWLTPLGGLAALLGALCGGFSVGLLHYWYARPQVREALRKRSRGSILLNLGEILLMLLWSAAAALLAEGSPWALAPAGVAIAFLFADTERREPRHVGGLA